MAGVRGRVRRRPGRPLPVDPGRAAELVGMLTGPSLARVADALRDLFDL